MSKPENPSAFPCPASDGYYPEFGMSLRDYFAGKAMASCLTIDRNAEYWAEKVAAASYKYADAMLAERAKKEGL